MSNVATTKLFENDTIILWDMVLAPGESTGMHTHHHNYMFYATQGSQIEIQNEQGDIISHIDVKTGESLEFSLEGDMLVCTTKDLPKVPVTHQAFNRGEHDYKEILIEFK